MIDYNIANRTHLKLHRIFIDLSFLEQKQKIMEQQQLNNQQQQRRNSQTSNYQSYHLNGSSPQSQSNNQY